MHGIPTVVLVPVPDAFPPPDFICLYPCLHVPRLCFHQACTLAAHYDEKHESAVLKIHCVCAKTLIILSNKLRREETEDRPSKAPWWKRSVSHSLSARPPRCFPAASKITAVVETASSHVSLRSDTNTNPANYATQHQTVAPVMLVAWYSPLRHATLAGFNAANQRGPSAAGNAKLVIRSTHKSWKHRRRTL